MIYLESTYQEEDVEVIDLEHYANLMKDYWGKFNYEVILCFGKTEDELIRNLNHIGYSNEDISLYNWEHFEGENSIDTFKILGYDNEIEGYYAKISKLN